MKSFVITLVYILSWIGAYMLGGCEGRVGLPAGCAWVELGEDGFDFERPFDAARIVHAPHHNEWLLLLNENQPHPYAFPEFRQAQDFAEEWGPSACGGKGE